MVNIGSGNNSDRRGLSFVIFIGIIGFSIARGVATFFTNYLWFDSINLNSVWIKILLTRISIINQLMKEKVQKKRYMNLIKRLKKKEIKLIL